MTLEQRAAKAEARTKILAEKVRQRQLQQQLENMERLYDAATPSVYRKIPTQSRSGDGVMQHAGHKMRDWARWLDENHDIAIGILNTLVDRVVGTGIRVDPMVTNRDGDLDEDLNKEIRELWEDWQEKPEVTGEYAFDEVQRQICRSWLRDGELLIQDVFNRNAINYLTEVRYSLELIEADLLPFELIDADRNITHGVRKDTWGRPLSYFLYREHPGNLYIPSGSRITQDLKEVDADLITHVKYARRIKQTRGVSVLHGVITRLDDIKDYEESERIAARVAAAFTGYIKRSSDMTLDTTNSNDDRSFEMTPGMIFSDLLPGEEVGTIGSERPNTELDNFRSSMLKAVAGGTGTNYSSISKNYDGNYSAQRQEMVESKTGYDRLYKYFLNTVMKPIYNRFIEVAVLQGAVRMRPTMTMRDMQRAAYTTVPMPWIQPKDETEADILAIDSGIKSLTQVQMDRGYDPRIIREQRQREKAQREEDGDMPAQLAMFDQMQQNEQEDDDDADSDAA